ncbi:hypothetical protein AVEN_247407-1 [Araneus ventricosus]|uniref:Uncharacterized protein n=1 Tax=Araneus ventricosus TaxID=182803 RepID=A0A4Y2M7G0_ARAVE|nr:hypothetical protein AVEN_247407-1 [Araneus ventricosus]
MLSILRLLWADDPEGSWFEVQFYRFQKCMLELMLSKSDGRSDDFQLLWSGVLESKSRLIGRNSLLTIIQSYTARFEIEKEYLLVLFYLRIAVDFNDGASTSVSVRTVQRTVNNMGSQSRRPTRVPLLTALHKALFLSWAQQHYHWTVND